jgi:hypothetical protein
MIWVLLKAKHRLYFKYPVRRQGLLPPLLQKGEFNYKTEGVKAVHKFPFIYKEGI